MTSIKEEKLKKENNEDFREFTNGDIDFSDEHEVEIYNIGIQEERERCLKIIEEMPSLSIIIGGQVIINGKELDKKSRDATLKAISKDTISRRDVLKKLQEKQ